MLEIENYVIFDLGSDISRFGEAPYIAIVGQCTLVFIGTQQPHSRIATAARRPEV